MIKLILLSGFLGAGKTTLMTNILTNFSNKKVGLIVNEFGETGVDGPLLAKTGVQMTELNNGSIFCACIKDHFLRSLIDMSNMNISYLFIEPTGLADPSEMDKILETIGPMLGKGYDYRGVVCVVDAETFPKLSKVLPALTRQVEYSGAAIINKADLVDEAQIEAIAAQITELNPNCEIIVTSHCQLDVKSLIERLAPADKVSQDSTNTPETRLYSTVLKPKGPVPVEPLRQFVEKLSANAYRIKGFLPADNGIIAVNAVGGVINIDQWKEENPPIGLVVISAIGVSIISRITEAMCNELKDKLSL
ncbi:MAG: GTP-binding protein [Defluviitaleaceae bacterium]|nr:GTP-binding protein [Defluviitaleaceae bacterium]